MLVCAACTVYLMGLLEPILRPFLWALFLVMGLGPAVALVERTLLGLCSLLGRCLAAVFSILHWLVCCCKSQDPMAKPLRQPRRSARNEDSPARVIGASSGGIELRSIGTAARSPRGAPASTASPRDGLTPDSPGGEAIADDSRDFPGSDGDDIREVRNWGPCAKYIAHSVAICIVVAAVLCAVGGFVIMVVQSVLSLQNHWEVYRRGAQNLATSVQGAASRAIGGLPKDMADEIAANALTKAEVLLSEIVQSVLSNVWRFVFELLMMGLYIAFWLANPMPVGSSMQELFKRYIILKGLACLGYGISVGLLLAAFEIDLAAFFGLAAFCLSFVPEVGALVAVILPAPVILFDSRLQSPALTFSITTFCQLGLKFVFANIVEVKLVEADHLMKMHPVIILLAVAFFGYIWGPTGMLLSVPLVAYGKVAMLSDGVPPRYRDPVLVLIEGDLRAPARHAQKRREDLLEAAGPSRPADEAGAGRTAPGERRGAPLSVQTDETQL